MHYRRFPECQIIINTSCMFLINKGAAVDGFIQRFQAANILPKGESEELFARYAQVAAVYPHHDPDMVSSHNDLFKPDNILFDGHRVWLVDWEAAFLNDRYADLAVVAGARIQGLSSAHLGGRGQPGGQPDENRLWQGSLGTALAERAASTIQRSSENRLRAACISISHAPRRPKELVKAECLPIRTAKSHCRGVGCPE